jgi:hypothetical protein
MLLGVSILTWRLLILTFKPVTCKPYSLFHGSSDKIPEKDDFIRTSLARIHTLVMRRKTMRQFLSTPIKLQIVIEAIATAC